MYFNSHYGDINILDNYSNKAKPEEWEKSIKCLAFFSNST